MDDAIKTLDASNGNLKYQNAIEKTKTRLDFALARRVLLMPSHIIIHKESIVGYNNYLTRVKDDMKLGVNNHINLGTRKASLHLMGDGPTKINPPNSHPSNPIHKQATEAQGLIKKKTPTTTQTDSEAPATQIDSGAPATEKKTDPVDPHHVNKALVAVDALVLVGFVVWASS